VGRERRSRLDALVVERGIADDIDTARALIMAGVVLVDDRPATKAGTPIARDSEIRLKRGASSRYVSRGGDKLAGALRHFAGLDVTGRVAIDVGASTGGFTDCLLQRGAERVFAVDVGYGQLAWRLRQDSRVVVLERTNVRHLTPTVLQDAVTDAEQSEAAKRPDLAVVDVSFISLEQVLRPLRALLERPADVVALIKPQFEAARADVAEGGVVEDPKVREGAIASVVAAAERLGFERVDGVDSDTPGAKKGNVEYLVWLRLT